MNSNAAQAQAEQARLSCAGGSVGRALVECDRGRALLVDDQAIILRLYQAVLSRELPGLKVDFAGDGEEAIRRFDAGHQGVLIMDIHMPVMDGREVFDRIRRLCAERGWDMPSVIFCTGYAPPDALKDYIAGDRRHCLLIKPVRNREIAEAVRQRLN